MTPRVTYEGEIILELSVESSARGQDTNIAGQNLPSFLSRKVVTKLRLRDGESNLLAGLLREDERRSLRGFPGILRLPIVKQLFSANDESIRQSDIVMLLTPRIIRTHELTATDLSPIYVGTQSNMALGGPPPLISVGGGEPPPPDTGAAAPGPPGAPAPAVPTAPPPRDLPPTTGTPVTTPGAVGVTPMLPPGSSPIPGTIGVPAQPTQPPPSGVTIFQPVEPAPAPPAAAAPPTGLFGTPVTPTPPPAGAAGAPAPPAPGAVPAPPPVPGATPAPTPGAAAAAPAAPAPAGAVPPAATDVARVSLSPPSEMRVGSGPYTVPVSISGASRLTAVTVSITFNPALLRVRSVSEGTFMRQGGATPTFTQQVDPAAGRIDIAIVRPGDQVGASTTGLLAAILLEPVAAGTGTLSISGSGTVAGSGTATLQFAPAGVVVR